MGLIDTVMFENTEERSTLIAGPLFSLPTKESMEKVRVMLKGAESQNNQEEAFLIQSKFQLLKLKGEQR